MRSNASVFRQFARLEDAMMRAAMPRVALIDPPQPQRAQLPAGVRVLRAPATLTYKMAEAHRGR